MINMDSKYSVHVYCVCVVCGGGGEGGGQNLYLVL